MKKFNFKDKSIIIKIGAFFLLCACVVYVMCGAFSKPMISVVMSTYNRASLVSRAIPSVLEQTFTDFEFIIIDDGSSDGTSEVLRAFASHDKRIRVITNDQNKGLIYSLNLGLDEARGKYIARMDDDDICMPTRFEKQLVFMEQNPDFIVVGSLIGHMNPNIKLPFHTQTDPEVNKVLLYMNTVPISHPASFIRRDFLNEHDIRYDYGYKALEDRKLWMDIVNAGGKLGNLPEILLLYRLHGSNPSEYYITQARHVNKFFDYEILKKFGDLSEFKGLKRCEKFAKMVERNKVLKILSQPILEEQVEKICPSIVVEPVSHRVWTDFFVFKGNKVCRQKMSTECAFILEKTSTTLTVKWEKWGRETFEKKNGTWYQQ